MPSISPETAIDFNLNFIRKPNMLFSRSGPVSKQELGEMFLIFDAAFVTRRVLPGFLGFITGWCGGYNSRHSGGCMKITGITM